MNAFEYSDNARAYYILFFLIEEFCYLFAYLVSGILEAPKIYAKQEI
jgi:hypothetical protein